MASVSAAELLGLSPPPAAQQRPPTASPVRVSQKAPAPSPRPPVASTSAFRYSATPEPAHVPQQQVAKPAPNTVKGKGKATGPPPSTSLLRRLAGPSDQKAGLHRDREEVKQIIYEASKGSKYFQAQEKKDAELTVKVNRLTAHLGRLLKERKGNVKAEEARVDEMLAELEKTRVLSETIVVVDADAFYASCHQREDPSLVGTAFAVGGGVLTTASYEARKYGCSSAMAGFVAKRLCPHLKFVSLDFGLYTSCSKSIMNILRQYGDISPASLDEAYCSLTDYCKRENVSPAEAAERMRAQVLAETGLSVSAGVSPNAMISKVAADENKPNGQCVIDPTPEACKAFTSKLAIRKIPGIGRVTERILQAVGVETVGDVYRLRGQLFLIRNEIGLNFLLRAYLGLGRTKISHASRDARKGISVERTFHTETDVEGFYKRLKNIAEGLAEDCDKSQYSGRTLTLKLKTHTFQSISRAKTLGSAIYFKDAATFYSEGKKLLDKEIADRRQMLARGQVPKGHEMGKPFSLRLLGLRLSNLRDDKAVKDGGKLDGWAGTKPKKAKSKSKSKGKSKINKEKVKKEETMDGDLSLEADLDEDLQAALEMSSRNAQRFADGADFATADDDDDEHNSHHDEGGEDDVPSPLSQKQPASSDPLWANFGGDDDAFLDGWDDEGEGEGGEGLFYNSIDRPYDYKPFFTAGESLNSKKQTSSGALAAPAAMKDRLSFESKRVKTEEEEAEEEDADMVIIDSGGMPCPVCFKTFAGSELALSAHVASHFDDDKPVKNKAKAGSSSKSSAPARKLSLAKGMKSRSVKDMFAKR